MKPYTLQWWLVKLESSIATALGAYSVDNMKVYDRYKKIADYIKQRINRDFKRK